ncbi:MAG TPA: isoprenylcysteine carboxylmethyltransferase family protein [Vicinamibacterales bacterium]|jgi:methyltransferase
MLPEITIALVSLAAVVVMMLAELKRSRANERLLRQRGASEPQGDPYRALSIVYPGIFVLMAAEGAIAGPPRDLLLIAGFAIFAAAKILKLWAITALGPRWSYRVLVLPGVPLVSTGPYAYLRHPNYVAVFGEIAGFALMVGARITGVLSFIAFALLVRRRIAVEEEALGSRYT